jgi:hypothetical protein
MRDLKEVQNEYASICAKIGDLEVRKQKAIEGVDAQLEPLHDAARALENEANNILAVQKELEMITNQTKEGKE